MIGLVWNSMMSMAGGWFFLSVTEAFTLKGHDYRLPGIGSYMNEAIIQGDVPAMVAVIAMVMMIVFVDQVVWRPLVAWSQRFRMDDIAQTDVAQLWMLDLLRKSRIYSRVSGLFARKHDSQVRAAIPLEPSAKVEVPPLSGPAPLRAGDQARRSGRRAPRRIWSAFELARGDFVVRRHVLGNLAVGAVVDWFASVGSRSRQGLASRSPSTRIGLRYFCAARIICADDGGSGAGPGVDAAGGNHDWTIAQIVSPFATVIQVVASFPAPMLFPLVTVALVGCTSLHDRLRCAVASGGAVVHPV